MCGEKPVMSKSARSRNRSPIRGRFGSRPAAGEMRGRINVRRARVPHREPHGVLDHAALDLVVADDRREDRQSGRVGRSPAVGPQLVRLQIEDRRAVARPNRAAVLRPW